MDKNSTNMFQVEVPEIGKLNCDTSGRNSS